MTTYCFNDNTDSKGNHEVHKNGCNYLPLPSNRTYLGEFTSDYQAISYARTKYPYMDFDGCYFCMNSEHTG